MIRILNVNQVSPQEIFARSEDSRDVSGIVRDIIADVRSGGDEALLRYAAKFDGAELEAVEVPRETMDAALEGLDSGFRAILEEAAENIRAFHSQQVRQSFVLTKEGGIVLGQKITPIEKVGLYIPGGTAAYPSSVLMNCIPAKIAGCREIVMVSPPSCGGDINSVILAAARITGFTLPSLPGGVTMTISSQPAILAGMESISTVEG